MKKAVFTAMTAVSLPVLLSSCGLFEQSSSSNLPPPTQTSTVPLSRMEIPKQEAPKSAADVKKAEAAPKSEAAPVADVKKTEAAPKSEAAPVADVKKTEAAPKSEAAPVADVKKTEAAPKSEAAPAADVKKTEEAPKAETVKTALPAKIELPCKYIVKTDDSLWRLSVEYYGKGAKWMKIYEANKDKIKNPDHLEPGVELTIPPLVTNQ